MINQSIIDILMAAPVRAPTNPDLVLTTTDPVEVALLTYGADVLCETLLRTANVFPSQIILSLVSYPAEGASLILLARQTPDDRLERQTLAGIHSTGNYGLIADAIFSHHEGQDIHHIEAICGAPSGHSRLSLRKRLHRYSHLARKEVS